MNRKEINKAKELAKETLAVQHKAKYLGIVPRRDIMGDFKKGREIAARLDAREATSNKPKSKAKSTAKPRMTRKSYRELLHRKK